MSKRAVIVVLTLLAWWGAWHYHKSVKTEEYQRLGRTMASLAEFASISPQRGWEPPSLDSYPELIGVSLLDLNGKVLGHKALAAKGPGQELSFPVNSGGEPKGTVVLQVSSAEQQRWRTYSLECVIALLLGLWTFDRLRTGRPLLAPPEAESHPPLSAPPDFTATTGEVVLELDGGMNIRSVRGDNSTLTGYDQGDLIGQPLWFLFEPGQVPHERASLESLSQLALLKTKAGLPVSSAVSAAIVDSPDGELDRVIVVLNGEQRNSEPYRQRVRELEQRYHDLCDQASDLVVVVQSDGRLFYANRAVIERSGYSAGALTGLPVWKLFFLGSGSQTSAGLRQLFHRALAGEHLSSTEGFLKRQDDSLVPVEGSFSPVQANGALGVMGIFRDLSERRSAEEAVRRSEDRLRQAQKMEAMGRVAGGVAHDFNNLLTVISSVTELLRLEESAQAQDELLEELGQAVSRASALTSQLLLFCRQKVAQPEILSLDDVISNLLKLARRVLGEDINMVSQLRCSGRVLSDRGELEQIMMNLLVNARDAMPGGGVLRVETSDVELPETLTLSATLRAGSYLRLQVSDSGVGIPSHVVPRIFEPYFTTKGIGEGTGLGLATLYAVVERLNGGILVDSVVGQGTDFIIYLPATTLDAVEKVPLTAQAGSASGESILLVEDDAPVRKLAARALRKQGYAVLEAAHGEEAMRIFGSGSSPIQVVITDLVMPGLHGRELARRLREKSPNLPILYVSGYPAEDMGVLGPNEAFLPKPFALGDLGVQVKKLLGGAAPHEGVPAFR